MFCCLIGAADYPEPCEFHGEFSEMTELPQQSVIIPDGEAATPHLVAIMSTSASTLSLDDSPWWQCGVAAAWHASVLVAWAGER